MSTKESADKIGAKTDLHLLLGCTGSVASMKIPLLLDEIHAVSSSKNLSVKVRLIPTQHACHFFDLAAVKSNPHLDAVFTDDEEWTSWRGRGDPVLHIELRKWADALLIAPLDANTLAKLSSGICDNLLTCVVRAWDVRRCRDGRMPVLFAPAMNTLMWDHPLTGEQIGKLKSFGFEEIPPVEKVLMCGDKGAGAMEESTKIAEKIVERLASLKNDDG